MKIVNLIFAVLFTLFAGVQYNDPDPWAWAVLYLYVALVCALSAFGRAKPYFASVGLAVSLIWMLSLLPDFIHWIRMGAPTIVASMKAEAPHIELTREFLGLLVCAAVFAWQWYRLSLRKG